MKEEIVEPSDGLDSYREHVLLRSLLALHTRRSSPPPRSSFRTHDRVGRARGVVWVTKLLVSNGLICIGMVVAAVSTFRRMERESRTHDSP